MNEWGYNLLTPRMQFTKEVNYKHSGYISVCGLGKYQSLCLSITVYILPQVPGLQEWGQHAWQPHAPCAHP